MAQTQTILKVRRELLLGSWIAKVVIGPRKMPASRKSDGLDEGARRVPCFFLKAVVPIERFVAGRVRLVVAHVAINDRTRCGGEEIHGGQPVGQPTAPGPGARCISLHDGGA